MNLDRPSFLQELENYASSSNNVFNQYDWWKFSKLYEGLDEVNIVYSGSNENNIANFKLDFILLNANKKTIMFSYLSAQKE